MKIRRALVAVVAAAAAIGLTAPAALAYTGFYYNTNCSVSPDNKARLSASWYDHSYGTEIHFDLNGTYPLLGASYYPYKVVMVNNGTNYYFSDWNDSYWIFWNRNPVKVIGYWKVSGVLVSCSRTYDPPAA